MSSVRERLVAAGEELKAAFVGRDDAIDCILLTLVSGTNFILVGDPGTAKSALVKRAFSHVKDARQFGILCGSFATEDKVFGPPNIKAFKDGEWARVTKNKLAGVELAFLDEVMKSNDGTLNSMLGALNEREYDGKAIPLWACGAATNWPEVRGRSEVVAALWDRFLLRCRVDCLTNAADRAKMISASEAVRSYAAKATVTVEELQEAREEARGVKVSAEFVRSLVDVAQRLRAEQVEVSDRRLASLVLVAQASAWIADRTAVEVDDIDALRFGLWNDEPHVAVVATIIESVDAEVKKRCLKAIAEAQANFKPNLSPSNTTEALRVMRVATTAAREVTPVLKSGMLRRANHALVDQELKKLRNSFEALHDKMKPQLGVDQGKPDTF